MDAGAGRSAVVSVSGVLRWNEFEGGFWSIELDPGRHELGDHAVLVEPPLPAGAADGTRVRGLVRAQAEQFGFTMAGPRVEVVQLAAWATPADGR